MWEPSTWFSTSMLWSVDAWAWATAEQAMYMEAHHRVCFHQNGASQSYHSDYFARWYWRMCSWFNKMCSLQKKTLTWSQQKRSRPALTYTSYYQISSPHLTWTTARVYVVPGGLRWPHQSLNKVQKSLLMQVNTFNFLCLKWERKRNIKKKNIANFSEWVRSARKPIFSSAVN